jgi:membrane-bound ClpP family serine protease
MNLSQILVLLVTLPLFVAAGFAFRLAVLGRGRKKIAIMPVIGMTGRAITGLNPEGTVSLGGNLWRAQAEAALSTGQCVTVTGYNGVIVVVGAPISQQGGKHAKSPLLSSQSS